MPKIDMDQNLLVVMKFGGTSLADSAAFDHAAKLVMAAAGPVVVVVSAMGKTTDFLLAAGRDAEGGEGEAAQAGLAQLRASHLEAAGDDSVARRVVEDLFAELTSLLEGVALLREQSERTYALLSSFGERLCAPLFAARLRMHGAAGLALDARKFIHTDDNYRSAHVELDRSLKAIREDVGTPLAQGKVPVITGFLGSTDGGITTTLGRSGSDFTATLVGQALAASEVCIWTDVDGILTADPRLVREARTLSAVSYREAAEMSYFGARVLHPRAILPAMTANIPIVIRNTFAPEKAGTRVTDHAPDLAYGVKTVTTIPNLSLVTVDGRGMAGVPGVARRIFEASESAKVNVVMISQASSEQTVTMVVPQEDAQRMEKTLRERFASELASGAIERVVCKSGVAVASIIGQGMAGTPGVSGKLFSALASVGVNVRAIAQGGSELSISLAIEEEAVERAVRAVHTSFGLTRICNILLVGCGRVGQTVLQLMEETRAASLKDLDLELRLVGVVNRQKLLFDPQGLSLAGVAEQLAGGSPRPDDRGLIGRLLEAHFTDVIVVDVTAADTFDLHQLALEAGFNVVTANKVPISGSLSRYDQLKDTVRAKGLRYGYETTFGAGLPVLHSLKELVNTGDQLLSITGCLSGTLGFICTRLQEGASLSEAVRQAQERGFTEPDPREDLSGRDVARKALIIARAAGMALEPADVELEPMVPGMDGGLVPAMEAFSAELGRQVATAKAEGKVLRYMAEIEQGTVRVGMRAVPAGSPVGSLSGPDNILVFRSKRYQQFPLVVRGPGAGAEVTAAGVLGDMLKVARGQ